MTASALISGRLQRDPAQKVSKSGKKYISALLKEGDGDTSTWWSLLAFSEDIIDELASLKAGDSLAVTGLFKSEIYQKGGKPRISHSLFVDRLIKANKQKRERPALQAQSEMPPFDDGIAL